MPTFELMLNFSQLKGVKPNEVRRIRRPPGQITFPLVAPYLKVNDTLEGRQAARDRDLNIKKKQADERWASAPHATAVDGAPGGDCDPGDDAEPVCTKMPIGQPATSNGDLITDIMKEALDKAHKDDEAHKKSTDAGGSPPAPPASRSSPAAAR